MSGGSPPRTFFDTNILVYTDDRATHSKQKRALDNLDEHNQTQTVEITHQEHQEYYVAVTRKYGVDPGAARRKIELFAAFDVVEPELSDILAAIDQHRLHHLSYWDALVIHCARRAGCKQVLSEDMQNGQVIDGVRIVNPFL